MKIVLNQVKEVPFVTRDSFRLQPSGQSPFGRPGAAARQTYVCRAAEGGGLLAHDCVANSQHVVSLWQLLSETYVEFLIFNLISENCFKPS